MHNSNETKIKHKKKNIISKLSFFFPFWSDKSVRKILFHDNVNVCSMNLLVKRFFMWKILSNCLYTKNSKNPREKKHGMLFTSFNKKKRKCKQREGKKNWLKMSSTDTCYAPRWHIQYINICVNRCLNAGEIFCGHSVNIWRKCQFTSYHLTLNGFHLILCIVQSV